MRHRAAAGAQIPVVPDWALPGSATHTQVAPPPDFHRPSKNFDTPIGIFEGQSDIGSALVPGSASYDAATKQYTINSAGYNIWYTRDEFRYPLEEDVRRRFARGRHFVSRTERLRRPQSGPGDSPGSGRRFQGGHRRAARRRYDPPGTASRKGRARKRHGVSYRRPRPSRRRSPDSLVTVIAQRIGIEKHGDSFALFVSLEGEPMHQFGPPITSTSTGHFTPASASARTCQTNLIRRWSRPRSREILRQGPITKLNAMMEYRQLGGIGTQSPGANSWNRHFRRQGRTLRRLGQERGPEATRLVDICLEAGLTMFDSADIYSDGMAEEILGQAIAGRRDKVLISTKATFRLGDGPNDVGSSRFHLIRAIDASLKRLGTDYIDLFQLHAFDAVTPIEETLSHARRPRAGGKNSLSRLLQFLRLAPDEITRHCREAWLSAVCRPPGLLFTGGP